MAFFFHSKINDADSIIKFLENEEIKKSKGHNIHFEVDYALNICKQNEKTLIDKLEPLQHLMQQKKKSENPTSAESTI